MLQSKEQLQNKDTVTTWAHKNPTLMDKTQQWVACVKQLAGHKEVSPDQPKPGVTKRLQFVVWYLGSEMTSG